MGSASPAKDEKWTIIHGIKYDLTDFKDHPGGETAIGWAYGRDATALFESYHVWNDRPQKLLEKYRCKEQPADVKVLYENSRKSDDWKDSKDLPDGWIWDDEFGQDLKTMVREHFGGRSHFMSWKRVCILLLFTLNAVFTGYFWFTGVWWSVLAFPLAGWLFGVNILHCASHRAISATPWVNDAMMLVALPFTSPIMWYHQHIIGHHAAPNTRKDPDLRHGLRFWRYHPNFPYRWWHRYQLAYFLYLWAWSVFALALGWDYFTVRDGMYRRTVPLKGLHLGNHLIERGLVVLLIFVIPFFTIPLHQAVFWGLSWYLVIGVTFAAISQVNHVSPDTLEAFDRRWYRHQAITALNYNLKSTFVFYFTGALNFQIEHHLFPGVNAEHLPGLSPKVQELCKKHNVTYPCVETYGKALLLHLDVLIKMAEEPPEGSQKKGKYD